MDYHKIPLLYGVVVAFYGTGALLCHYGTIMVVVPCHTMMGNYVMSSDADVINLRLPADLGAAFRQAAAANERSINGQAIIYLRKGLIADGHYQSSVVAEGAKGPAAEPAGVERKLVPMTRALRVAAAASPKPRPPARPEPPSGVRVGAIIAAIGVEVRFEQNRPLGKAQIQLRELIESTFRDVTDLASARAKGAAAWLEAGARPGMIEVLFPDDRGAMAAAKKAQNRVQRYRGIAVTEDRRLIAEKGIIGQGASSLRRVLAERFAGLTIDQAVAKGPAEWLEGGLAEETARRLFGDEVGAEAKRRTQARSNQRKRARRQGGASADGTV
jgi:hypothetical protein